MIFIAIGLSTLAGVLIGIVGTRLGLDGKFGAATQRVAADFLEVDLDLDEVVVQVRR